MSHAYAIQGTSASGADVTVPVIDQANFRWRKTEILKDGATLTTFVDSTSPTDHEVLVTVRVKDIPGRGSLAAQREWNVTHLSWATDTDSVTGIVVYNPIRRFLGGSDPVMGLELSDLRDYVGNVYGLLWTTLTAKVPDTGIIGDLTHGLSKLYDN